MYAFSELTVHGRPEIETAVVGESRKCFVFCHAWIGTNVWMESRNMYLHAGGLWSESTHSKDGPTGYFDSREAAERVLELSIAETPPEVFVFPSNIDAQAIQSRMSKREHRT